MRTPSQKNRIFHTILIVAVSSALIGLTGCNKSAEEPKSEAAPNHANVSAPLQVEAVRVQKENLLAHLDLPGELESFRDVPLHAKVQGFISWIGVDRGSHVKKDQPLIVVTAPELDAKVKEAEAKVSASDSALKESQASYQSMRNKQAQVKAKLDSDELTYNRLMKAAQTPGAIAQNEVDVAQKTVEGDKANLDSLQAEVAASENLVTSQRNNWLAAKKLCDSVRAMRSYLTIRAPFDGVITERNVHEGSIVAVDASRTSIPMLRIQQNNILRLVVAVPEESVAGIHKGASLPFTVPAFPGRVFHGTVVRPGYALDRKTRTMPVELDVQNQDGDLEPGMFATVKWSITRPYATLFLPSPAVATDLKGTFAVRVNNGVAERVSVSRGYQMNNQVEVVGDLKEGDLVALQATDEIKPGSKVAVKEADEHQTETALHKDGSGGGE